MSLDNKIDGKPLVLIFHEKMSFPGTAELKSTDPPFLLFNNLCIEGIADLYSLCGGKFNIKFSFFLVLAGFSFLLLRPW